MSSRPGGAGRPLQCEAFLKGRFPALTEGSVSERLRRRASVRFDPHLGDAALIYDPRASRILEMVHREYIAVARRFSLPILVFTDTWRANREHILRSRYRAFPVNQDNAQFLAEVRSAFGADGPAVYIGGEVGPRSESYRPGDSLSRDQAAAFHAYQVDALAEGGVDFLHAATLCSLAEAAGIAQVMAETGLPYVLSFRVDRTAALPDGAPFDRVIAEIEAMAPRLPAGYAVNCVHPADLRAGLGRAAGAGRSLSRRILIYQANSGPCAPEAPPAPEAPCDIAGGDDEVESPEALAGQLWELGREFGIPILGGCCGTDARHIASLAAWVAQAT